MSIIHVENNQFESRIDEEIGIHFKQLNPNQTYKIVLKRRAVTKTHIIYRESWASFTSARRDNRFSKSKTSSRFVRYGQCNGFVLVNGRYGEKREQGRTIHKISSPSI